MWALAHAGEVMLGGARARRHWSRVRARASCEGVGTALQQVARHGCAAAEASSVALGLGHGRALEWRGGSRTAMLA